LSKLSTEKLKLLETSGHILALGGPGSGKTYIALLKADREINDGRLLSGQRILFLSFARATIARVTEEAAALISASSRRAIEINTYHGFAWRLLQSHAYLINANRPIRLLPPPEAAARLAPFDMKSRTAEKERLFVAEGFLHFDLFAAVCGDLLSRSQSLLKIICDTYPIIILDEFQDTNSDEWRLIQELGRRSTLIALADADQRIYEFRGADPARIGDFINRYSPTQFDFGSENNRSNGTDIVVFGNDLLTGSNKRKAYQNVSVVKYQVRKGIANHSEIKLTVIKRCSNLRNRGSKDWSLAVLVPTKQLMIEVSDYLGTEQRFGNGSALGVVPHQVALETAGPALAAIVISSLLEGGDRSDLIMKRLILDLCEHIRGRKGNEVPSRAQLELADALHNYVQTGSIRGPKRNAIVAECGRIAETRLVTEFTGNPGDDWLAVRRELRNANADPLQLVAEDAKYLRLLHRGALLRARLSEIWRTTGRYIGAASAVRDALLQEHFSASVQVPRGIHVMTIHKSKGKEFDEVIIYEGSHQGRIVRMNASDKEMAQSRLALRVAVTRAMKHTTILTPSHDACRFL
jgi:DNA helicase II / ATP-dependent DNA helicase PcrA